MATLPYAVIKRKSSKKLKDGTSYNWESKNYYLRFYLNGKLTYKDLNTSDKKEADKAAVQLYAIATKDSNPAYSPSSLKSYLKKNKWFSDMENPLFTEFHSGVSSYRMGYAASKALTSNLDYVFNDLNDELGNVHYLNITKKDVKSFKERLLKTKDKNGVLLKPSRINRIFSALSDVYNYLNSNDEKKSISNPFSKDYIERIKEGPRNNKFVFQPKEIKRLLDDNLLRMCTDVRLALAESKIRTAIYDYDWWLNFINGAPYKLLSFMALTGLRQNEATALTKGSFDKEYNRIVKIDKAFKLVPSFNQMKDYLDGKLTYKMFDLPKNGEERTIVLCDKAYDIVKPLIDACEYDTDLIFVKKRGEGNYRNLYHLYYSWTRHNYRPFMMMFCNKFNIKVPENEILSPHCLRTTLNSNLIREDTPEVKESWIAAYLGWITTSLTRTQSEFYTKLGTEPLWKVANAINILYTEKEMMWKPFIERKRDINIEKIEAEIRAQSQKLKALQIKALLIEITQKISLLGSLGLGGSSARSGFRYFVRATKDFESTEDYFDLVELVGENLGKFNLGLENLNLNLPDKTEEFSQYLKKLEELVRV